MIQANEVMNGNYLRRKSIDAYCRVTPLMISEIEYGGHDYEPIPLTPDILRMCGFIYRCISFKYLGEDIDFTHAIDKDKYIHLTYDNDNGNWMVEIGEWVTRKECADVFYNTAFYVCDINYLHHLQNLYYSLTGQELTVNFEK